MKTSKSPKLLNSIEMLMNKFYDMSVLIMKDVGQYVTPVPSEVRFYKKKWNYHIFEFDADDAGTQLTTILSDYNDIVIRCIKYWLPILITCSITDKQVEYNLMSKRIKNDMFLMNKINKKFKKFMEGFFEDDNT